MIEILGCLDLIWCLLLFCIFIDNGGRLICFLDIGKLFVLYWEFKRCINLVNSVIIVGKIIRVWISLRVKIRGRSLWKMFFRLG